MLARGRKQCCSMVAGLSQHAEAFLPVLTPPLPCIMRVVTEAFVSSTAPLPLCCAYMIFV